MMRRLMKGKIHRATVTEADLHYEGSITIDPELMEAADIVEFESVEVWNVTNGNRLQTYAIPGHAGDRGICLNGAAARLVAVGDLVIIASFADYDEEEVKAHKPKVVLVDEHNEIKKQYAKIAPRSIVA